MANRENPIAKTAGVIITLAALYVFWTGSIIHDQPDREALIAAIWRHVGLGVLAIVPALAWLVLPKGVPLARPGMIARGVKWAARALQLSIALLLLTGPLTVWARGSALKVFDWFAIPSPVERMQGPYAFLEASHGVLAQVFLFSVVVYVLAKAAALLGKRQA